jgi:hypothetical protein
MIDKLGDEVKIGDKIVIIKVPKDYPQNQLGLILVVQRIHGNDKKLTAEPADNNGNDFYIFFHLRSIHFVLAKRYTNTCNKQGVEIIHDGEPRA